MLSGKLRVSAATLAAFSAIQLSACSDKLPEIHYGSVDFTIGNPEVLPLLSEEYNELVMNYSINVSSVVGPYLHYYVDEDGNISLHTGVYYIFDDNGYNEINNDAYVLLSTEAKYLRISDESDFVPDYSRDDIVEVGGTIVGRNYGDFYYQPHITVGNEYCTYVVIADEVYRRSELYDFPNPPDGIEELVEDIANRYGDVLFELAPEAREVPLELLEDVSE